MKNKFAMMSWILPIVGLIIYIFILIISSNMRIDAGIGSPITPQERLVALIFSIVFLLIIVTGFVFGIVGLVKRTKNPNMGGKTHAIVGIILNAILFFYGLLLLGGSLIGG